MQSIKVVAIMVMALGTLTFSATNAKAGNGVKIEFCERQEQDDTADGSDSEDLVIDALEDGDDEKDPCRWAHIINNASVQIAEVKIKQKPGANHCEVKTKTLKRDIGVKGVHWKQDRTAHAQKHAQCSSYHGDQRWMWILGNLQAQTSFVRELI